MSNKEVRLAKDTAIASGLKMYIGRPCKHGHTERYTAGVGRCVMCHSGWNKNARDQSKNRQYQLKFKYGMLPGDFEKLVDGQGGVCAMCKQPPSSSGFVVDHCHDTGRVRGLLHPRCNTALGYFGDSITELETAISYLSN